MSSRIDTYADNGYSAADERTSDSLGKLIAAVESSVFEQLHLDRDDIAAQIAGRVRRTIVTQSSRNLSKAVRDTYSV
jgi:hypothetical protein